jgi:hypothetical protein
MIVGHTRAALQTKAVQMFRMKATPSLAVLPCQGLSQNLQLQALAMLAQPLSPLLAFQIAPAQLIITQQLVTKNIIMAEMLHLQVELQDWPVQRSKFLLADDI